MNKNIDSLAEKFRAFAVNGDESAHVEDEIKPYPGLRPFRYKENFLFFGREGKAQEIALRLQESHFVAVVGTSGSGKSSVVGAGLLPLLYGGMLYESGSHWRIAFMRPGEKPIRNLAEALAFPIDFETEHGEETKDETLIGIAEAVLRRSGVGLLDFVNNPINKFAEEENLLIVVDQFEELFRFKEKFSRDYSEEAAAFVKLLLEGTRDAKGRIFVVITMRSDFLGDCAQFHDFPEAINEGQYLIPQMTREQLRQSIESPALVGGAEVSPALVNRILNDLESEEAQFTDVTDRTIRDQLPVLQHALLRTWNLCSELWEKTGETKKVIDVKHYKQIGGLTSALSAHADETFDSLSAREKLITEKMFKCLTETDSENREIRRPAKIEEICAVANAGKKEVVKIVELFREEGRTFLMPPSSFPLNEDTKIDISHESLIRNWGKLREWVREEAENARQYRRITDEVFRLQCYREENKDRLTKEELEKNCLDFLLRGIELKDAISWRDNFKPNVAWASRYQTVTESERQMLTQLSRVSPADERKVRRQFVRKHFSDVEEFLKKSSDNEIARQAEKERIQRERLAHESEKAANALALAEAEREKNESLEASKQTLEASKQKLERQKKRLQVAVAVCALLMVSALVSMVVAWRYWHFAALAQENAEKQKQVAEEQKRIADDERDKAKKQEEIARDAKDAAEHEKETADQEKENAKRSEEKALGEKQRADVEAANAKRQKIIADGERDKALKAQGKLVDELERSDSNLGGLTSLENSDYDRAISNFQKLESKAKNLNDETKKTLGIWWAKYNIAKAFQEQGKFENARIYFQDALDSLPQFQKENLIQTSIVSNFADASYFPVRSFKLTQPSAEDNPELMKARIITLRKFARFYGNCAKKPEECFEKESYDADNKLMELSFFYSTDLNDEARILYEKLIGLAGDKTPNDIMLLAQAKKELADIYLDLDEPLFAEDLYAGALKVYDSSKSLTDISTREKYLETQLLLAARPSDDDPAPRLKIAAEQVGTILEKRKQFLLRIRVPEKDIPTESRMGETYAALSLIYQKYRIKASQKYVDKVNGIRIERSRNEQYAEQKTEPKQAAEPVDDNQTPRPSPTPRQETPQEKAFFGRLLNTYLYGDEEYAMKDDKLDEPGWKKEIWSKLSEDFRLYKTLSAKARLLGAISEKIKVFNDKSKTPGNTDYVILGSLYLSNNEVEKANAVFAFVDEYTDGQFAFRSSVSAKKAVDSRLEALKLLARSQRGFMRDSCGAEFAGKWAEDFEGAFPNWLTSPESKTYAEFYTDAGIFYYLCPECADSSAKARRMFTLYSQFLTNNKDAIKEPDTRWTERGIFVENTKLKILGGLIDEREKKVDAAIRRYNELAEEIPTWKKNNPELTPTPRPANVSSNVNANKAAISNTNNSNIAATTTVVKPDERFSFYEAYVRLRAAELSLSRDEKIATNLPAKYTQNFAINADSDPFEGASLLFQKDPELGFQSTTLLIQQYAVAAKNIGDFFRGKEKEQAIRYYQSAADALKFFKLKQAEFCNGYESRYCVTDPNAVVLNFSRAWTGMKLGADYYRDYIAVLEALTSLRGEDAQTAERINSAKKELENVKSISTRNPAPLCAITQK